MEIQNFFLVSKNKTRKVEVMIKCLLTLYMQSCTLFTHNVGPEVADLSLFHATSSTGCGGSWFKEARGSPPVDVPQRHVPCWFPHACSSTHKVSLTMLLLRIWQRWGLDVSSNVCLRGVGGWRRPLVSASAGNPRDGSVFFHILGFYLQSFQEICFFLVCFSVFTFIGSCNLILY
jgi:hypothetical protein